MKAIRTWILIANATQARIISHIGPGHGLKDIAEMTYADTIAGMEKTNRNIPGRTFDSSGTSRHAMEPHADQQDLERTNFAHFLTENLKKQYIQEKFDRLIIAASPAMLGNIRKALPKAIDHIIYAELPKDLSHIDTAQLSKHLEDVLAV
jgi:protein required for attachment to host cells